MVKAKACSILVTTKSIVSANTDVISLKFKFMLARFIDAVDSKSAISLSNTSDRLLYSLLIIFYCIKC